MCKGPIGSIPCKGLAHRWTKVEFTKREKEVGVQLPLNIFGPLGNSSQGPC